MRKEESPQLDEIDYRILTALQINSRTPMKALAKTANVSIPTARSRLQRLLDLRLVKFTVAVDSGRIVGGISAFFHIKARVHEVHMIVQNLIQLDEVDAIYNTTGEHDLVVRVSFPDMHSFNEFFTNKISQIPGVEYIRSDIVIDTFKERYGFSLRPGFGVKLTCSFCRKQIEGMMVRKTIDGQEYYFCCATCSDTFQKETIKNVVKQA